MAAAARGAGAGPGRGAGRLGMLGVPLLAAGLAGLGCAAFSTLTSMLLFGWLLLAGGLAGLLHSVQARGTGFFWPGVTVAALNLAAGVVLLRDPDAPARALTLFAALLFLSAGLYRLVGALVVRGPLYGVTLVLGALDLLLGVLVLGTWPSGSRYAVGTFLSLALLLDGLALITSGFGGPRTTGGVPGHLPGRGPGDSPGD
ncbi:DUF308 domain-containing protein [Streptomyces sp. NPDC093252]|uniref:DUF308 domain-containing protein n=1 Tax=Streptomyces sp. NPDC093252 TaxID=3154980 RepID=UPI003442ABAB